MYCNNIYYNTMPCNTRRLSGEKIVANKIARRSIPVARAGPADGGTPLYGAHMRQNTTRRFPYIIMCARVGQRLRRDSLGVYHQLGGESRWFLEDCSSPPRARRVLFYNIRYFFLFFPAIPVTFFSKCRRCF